MRLFSSRSRVSFIFLNVTQFLGALNDNVFKLLVIFMLISIRGTEAASSILSSVGAVFVIPFLIFSSAAGVIADRISKRSILVYMKFLEIIVMCLSVFAMYLQSQVSLYVLLFLMAAQSTVFGPSKYGIIPELVKPHKLSKANGILVSLSFLAIILGTFLGSFLTDITNKNFVIAASLCVIIAIIGYITSLKIQKTNPRRSSKKVNIFFLYEIYQIMKLSYKRKHLMPAIFGSAFFLFVGGFIQLNTIPFAIQSLNLSDVGGGYLFLSTAIGIASGSLIAGKVSKIKLN